MLIAMSFMLLVFTVSTMMTNYSISSKKAIMRKAVESVSISMETYVSIEKDGTLADTVRAHNAEIMTELVGYASLSDSDIYIVASDGTLLATSDKSREVGEAFMTPTTFLLAASDTSVFAFNNRGYLQGKQAQQHTHRRFGRQYRRNNRRIVNFGTGYNALRRDDTHHSACKRVDFSGGACDGVYYFTAYHRPPKEAFSGGEVVCTRQLRRTRLCLGAR